MRPVPEVAHRPSPHLVAGEVDAARDDVARDPLLTVRRWGHVPLANPVPVEGVRILSVAHAVFSRERALQGCPAHLHDPRGAYGDLVLPPAVEDARVGFEAGEIGAGVGGAAVVGQLEVASHGFAVDEGASGSDAPDRDVPRVLLGDLGIVVVDRVHRLGGLSALPHPFSLRGHVVTSAARGVCPLARA